MAHGSTTRVLLIGCSAALQDLLKREFTWFPQLEIVGSVDNARSAQTYLNRLSPHVILYRTDLTSIHVRSEIQALKRPVILLLPFAYNRANATSVGAVDFCMVPRSRQDEHTFCNMVGHKVLTAYQTFLRQQEAQQAAQRVAVSAAPEVWETPLNRVIIALGASTGGTETTLGIMKQLPADLPPMVVVQHMPPGFTRMYAQRLNQACKMEVREGRHGDELRRGLVLVAPADLQTRIVRVGKRYSLSCTDGARVSGHKPSVDALFQSMADTVKNPMVGIILTGMGGDGAKGLLAMREKGAYTIGENADSAVVYGMPKEAHELGAVTVQAHANDIPAVLVRHLKSLDW